MTLGTQTIATVQYNVELNKEDSQLIINSEVKAAEHSLPLKVN